MIDSGMFQEGVWRVTKGWETRVMLGFDGATRMMFIWICIIASCQLLFGAKMLVRDAIFLYISMYLFKISVSYTGIIVSVAAIAAPYIFTFCVKMFGEDCVKLILRGSLITVLVLTLAATVMDLSNTGAWYFPEWANWRPSQADCKRILPIFIWCYYPGKCGRTG